MTSPVRLAVQIPPQHADYAELREAVARVEGIGVDIAFSWDHFFPLWGDRDGKHLEPWTLLAAWAEHTSSIELGVLVTAVGYRNPDLLADMARTVDHISGGRLVLGIGAGWAERDYTEYGYEFGTAGSRIADLAEGMERVRARWARLNPPPTRDIPVLIGGGGERKTLRVVARHADIWHSFADAEEFRRKDAILAEHCSAVGRDPREITRSVSAETTGGPGPGVDAHVEAGARLVVLRCAVGTDDVAHLDQWIAWRDAQNS